MCHDSLPRQPALANKHDIPASTTLCLHLLTAKTACMPLVKCHQPKVSFLGNVSRLIAMAACTSYKHQIPASTTLFLHLFTAKTASCENTQLK